MLFAAHMLAPFALVAADIAAPAKAAGGIALPIRAVAVRGAAPADAGILRGRIEVESYGIRMPAGARTIRASRDGAAVAEVKTTLAGDFELRIPAGRYDLSAGPFAIGGNEPRMVRVDTLRTDDQAVTLTPVAAVLEIDAPAAPADAPAANDETTQAPIEIDNAGRIKARIATRNAAGKIEPIARAEIVIARDGIAIAKIRADEAGVFSAPGIEPGALTVQGAAEGKIIGIQRIAAIIAASPKIAAEPAAAEFKADGEELAVFVAFQSTAAEIPTIVLAPATAPQAEAVVAGQEIAGCNTCEQVANQCNSCGACGSSGKGLFGRGGGFGGGAFGSGLGGGLGSFGAGVGGAFGAGGGLISAVLGAGALSVAISNNNGNGGTAAASGSTP